jgi:hypothetical protein
VTVAELRAQLDSLEEFWNRCWRDEYGEFGSTLVLVPCRGGYITGDRRDVSITKFHPGGEQAVVIDLWRDVKSEGWLDILNPPPVTRWCDRRDSNPGPAD